METAIQKAIEGGYKFFDWVILRFSSTIGGEIRLICRGDEYSPMGEETVWCKKEQILLDPPLLASPRRMGK